MKISYKIYKVTTIPVNPETHHETYYSPTVINPTVLRELYQPSFTDKDIFDSEAEAEKYLEEHVIKEFGYTYTIIKQYSYN